MQHRQQTLTSVGEPTTEAPATPDQPGTLRLSYENDAGNAIVVREYTNHGAFVREVDRELMYNYSEEKWETVHRFVHDYDLADDEETLAGDGSNWRGTNQQWETWFTKRHYERLQLRFPNDDIPDDPATVDNHDPVDVPGE